MLGNVIQQNHRDRDDRMQHIMAAYRATKHESTGFSPNMLVLGRENRAPLDLVLGEVATEVAHYNSYDYDAEMQERLCQGHALAREHLDASAERRKNQYDIKVKSSQFKVGQWVWYFYPRQYVNKYPKWCKNYDGPFMVTATIPPSDYVIQRTKRSQPQVVHGDKLNPYYGETPKSWLSTTFHEMETEEQDIAICPVDVDESKLHRTSKGRLSEVDDPVTNECVDHCELEDSRLGWMTSAYEPGCFGYRRRRREEPSEGVSGVSSPF